MSTKRMSRRDFLRVSGMSVAGLALVACAAPVAPGASSGAESAPSDGVTEIRLGT